MKTFSRHIAILAILSLFSLPAMSTDTTTKKQAETKTEKKHQEARTLDGKKPQACNFRISLS